MQQAWAPGASSWEGSWYDMEDALEVGDTTLGLYKLQVVACRRMLVCSELRRGTI